ncbi:membrane or secreted protein [Neorhodopirellula lusitana]
MKKYIYLTLLLCLIAGGCAAVRSILPGGNSDYDHSRQFWDQTSDSPFR